MKDVLKGTTTIGLKFKDGVVLATDMRASMGNLVSHKTTNKLIQIDKHLASTIAGSVGDAQSITTILSAETRRFKYDVGRPISVKAVTRVASHILHNNRYASPFSVQLIIGGFDSTGASIYSMDGAGGYIPEIYTSTGSGSTVAYGVLEDRWTEDMVLEDGVKLAIRALRAAMERDTFSGNGINLCTITKDGFKRFTNEEIKEIIESL
jgi:proteasome beta subunit